MPAILFAVESAESRSLPLNAQRLVNFFTEKQQPGSKSQTPLFGVPGMSAFANTASVVGGIVALGSITGGSGYIPPSMGIGTVGSIAGGSGYTPGTYTSVPLTGGSGTGAEATIVVNTASQVSEVTVTTPGSNYVLGDIVSAAVASIGGAGLIGVLGSITPGSLYTDGSYSNVPLTGGSGTGARANIVVSGNAVTSVALTVFGINYVQGDTLSADAATIGGTGSGFSIPVSAVETTGSGFQAAVTTLDVYNNVPLTGGSGTGAQANITVSGGGAVNGVTITAPGINYVVGDILSADAASIGGSGSGFSVPVVSLSTSGSIRGSWVKQDVPYVVSGQTLYQLGLASSGIYTGLALTGGNGNGATANITLAGGIATAAALNAPGNNYQVGDVLSAPLGGGSGFSINVATLSNPVIAALGAVTGGSGYVSGNYYGVPLTGGSGAGAMATVAVTNGAVSDVQLAVAGTGYVIGDVLSASNADLGGAGAGFSVPVDVVSGEIATLNFLSGGSGYQFGTATIVGTGIGGSQILSMSDNGFQLCIVAGEVEQGWILDTNPDSATFGFQNITEAWTAAGFGWANTVAFFDGYFVFDNVGTNEFFLSGLYDGTAYNGLDFASAESQPDFVTGTIQNLQLLFVICQAHLELWYDAGAANFPFQRYTGAGISYGSVSPQSIIKQDGAIFFLGSDKIFYRLQSTIPLRTSTHAIEHIIAQDPDITQAYCLTFTLEGHKFIVLQLPASKRTLVFDISTNRWAERESWDANNNSLGSWRASTAFRAFNNTYLGDAINGNVNLLDWTIYTELGNTIRGLAYSVPYNQDRKRLFISRFELDIQTGVGTVSGPGYNPQITLGWSVDGAQTFKPLQPWRSMGRIGEYLKRLRWLRMGNARQWVFVLECTDPVTRVIIAAHADISIGM